MSNNTIVGAVIADIHWGAMDAKTLYEELDNGFLKYLKSSKILDFVVIAGDLFDTKLHLSSDHVKYSFIFLKKLIDICIKKNTKLRIIKGTSSHDHGQLSVLQSFSNLGADFKIISSQNP